MALDVKTQLSQIATIARQTALMTQTYRAWSQSDWERPTYCPGWQAADAVAHLATGGDFYAQVITSGRTGTPTPAWGVTDLAEFRAARRAAGKKMIDAGPEALITGFAQGATQLQEVLESLQEEDLAKTAWHPRGLVPIGSWIGMRITELGIHDWDIRQPHETPAHLSSAVLPALLGTLPDMQMQFLGQRAEGLDGVYVLRAGETSWGFTVQGKTVTYHTEAPAMYDAGVSADAEQLILLTMGRADVDAAALTVTGDADKGQQLCATLFQTF